MKTLNYLKSCNLINPSKPNYYLPHYALLFLTFLFFSGVLHAQDIIIKKDGTEINAKVQEINQRVVKYKKQEMPEGPTYEINKTDVFMIKYPSGHKDIFNEPTDTPVEIKNMPQPVSSKEKGYKNAIGMNPIMFALNLSLQYGYVEYEQLVGNSYSIGGRISRAKLTESDYWEKNTGGGIFIRKYFNKGTGLNGFYIGSNLEVYYSEWGEWWGEVGNSRFEYGQGAALVFTSQLGCKISLGEKFYLDPSLSVGFYNSYTESDYSEYSERGVIALPALTVGLKF